MDARDSYTAEEVDAAVAALSAPERLHHARDVVTHAAPALQRVLNAALEEGGWFGEAHHAQVTEAAGVDDPGERARAISTLVAEETRVGMLVGVSVGFALAHELAAQRAAGRGEGEAGVEEDSP